MKNGLPTLKTFGEIHKELRLAKNLSLRKYAKKVGNVSASFISDIELGRRFPSEITCKKIADVLGIPRRGLWEGDARPPIDLIRRLSKETPLYGAALRKLVSKDISPEKIMAFANKFKDRDEVN